MIRSKIKGVCKSVGDGSRNGTANSVSVEETRVKEIKKNGEDNEEKEP